MRLTNIRRDGTTRAARADGDPLVVFQDELTDLLRRPGWQDIAGTCDGERVPAEGASFAPLVTKPDKIICAGLNYKGHIAETGRPAPEYPFFFSKFPAALIGAHLYLVAKLGTTAPPWIKADDPIAREERA